MPETTPLIKAALNLRVGAGFDVYVRSAAFEAGRNSKAQWEACDTNECGRGYGA